MSENPITSPAPNDVINSNTITVTGTSEPDDLVSVRDSDLSNLGTTQASHDGEWSVDIALPDGTHTIVAVTRQSLDTFLTSDPVTITVSGGSSVSDGVPELVIISPPSGTITHDGTAVIHGTAPPGYAVRVFDSSRILLADTAAGDDGRWSAGISLPYGMHFVVIVGAQSGEEISHAVDVVCSAGPAQCALGFRGSGLIFDRLNLYSFGEARLAPVWPEMTSPPNGATIYDTEFVMAGVSEPNARIDIQDAFLKTIGTTTADEDGNWSVPVSDHSGTHMYSIMASTDDHPYLHTLAFLNIVAQDDEQLPRITSPANGALVRDGSSVLITGTAKPNSVVILVDLRYSPLATVVADGSGDWSATVRLAEGTHVLAATEVTDGAVSAHSAFATIHVDSGALALDRPVITSPGEVSLHRDSTVTVRGTAVPGSAIQIINHDAEIATTMSDAAGAWSATIDMPAGLYTISAIASLGDATRSGPSAPITVVVNPEDPRSSACR